MAEARDFDVVVLGATGVTGRQAVGYLRTRGGELGVKWAIAGRDQAKLERLLEGWSDDERPVIVRADSGDPASLKTLAESCTTLVNFAGPFARLAPPVIAACVEGGANYIDVTGEIGFVGRMIDEHHERAREQGVRIVQVAGFEAMPTDLLTRLGIERLAAEHDARPESADLVLRMTAPPGRAQLSDGVSGGTAESMRGMLTGEDPQFFGDPAFLVKDAGDAEAVRRTSPVSLAIRRDPGGGLLGPMMPSPELNPPVIHRSVALAGLGPIRFRESIAMDSLVSSRPAQLAIAGTLGGFNRGLRLLGRSPAPVRKAGAAFYGAITPSSSEGPSNERLEGWKWSIDGAVSGGGNEVHVHLDAVGHPGYLATSRMTAEAGLILADPNSDLPDAAGCITPAAALGVAELDRFAAAGADFSAD